MDCLIWYFIKPSVKWSLTKFVLFNMSRVHSHMYLHRYASDIHDVYIARGESEKVLSAI